MNYYELIYLSEEFKTKLTNSWLERAITPFKNQLELFISNEEESFRLVFNASPGNAALFIDSYRPAKKSNTQNFFEHIYGKKIIAIQLEQNERLIYFEFENHDKLWFKLYGSKANAILTSEKKIIATFKDRDEVGDDEPIAHAPILFDDTFDADFSVEKKLQKLIPLLPKKWILDLTENLELEHYSKNELLSFARDIDDQLRTNASFRILENGSTTLIPESILPIETKNYMDSVNALIQFRFKNYAHSQRLNQLKGVWKKNIQRQLKRSKSALRNLQKADKGLEKADTFEKFGHLLMANAHLDKPNAAKIVVEDLYQNGNEITIPLNADLSLAENAQHYYSRSSNSIKSYEEAVERIPLLEEKIELYESLLSELESFSDVRSVQDWLRINRKELGHLDNKLQTKEEQTIPFYVKECMGYTIWIGKNARNNDELVKKSHKEDVWLHARGVAGSHVVIRMANNKHFPEMPVIEEVASMAAYQSKAKGSNLVPVIYTKRKFIRKPKGSLPGAVTVQKEQVLIVEPKNPFK